MSSSRQQEKMKSVASDSDDSPQKPNNPPVEQNWADEEDEFWSKVYGLPYPRPSTTAIEKPAQDNEGAGSSAEASGSGTTKPAASSEGEFWDRVYKNSSTTVKAPAAQPKTLSHPNKKQKTNPKGAKEASNTALVRVKKTPQTPISSPQSSSQAAQNVVAPDSPTTTTLTTRLGQSWMNEYLAGVAPGVPSQEGDKQIEIRFYSVESPDVYINIDGEESIRVQLRCLVQSLGMPYFKDIVSRFGGKIAKLALGHHGGGYHWTQIKLVVAHGGRSIEEMGFSLSEKFEFGLRQNYRKYSSAQHTPVPTSPKRLVDSGIVVSSPLGVHYNPTIHALAVPSRKGSSRAEKVSQRQRTWHCTPINGRNVESGQLEQTTYHGNDSPEMDLHQHRKNMGEHVRKARVSGNPKSRTVGQKYYQRFLKVEKAMGPHPVKEGK